jgi:hypothetical protein
MTVSCILHNNYNYNNNRLMVFAAYNKCDDEIHSVQITVVPFCMVTYIHQSYSQAFFTYAHKVPFAP